MTSPAELQKRRRRRAGGRRALPPHARDALIRYYDVLDSYQMQQVVERLNHSPFIVGSSLSEDTADPEWNPAPNRLTFDGVGSHCRVADVPVDFGSEFEIVSVVNVKDGSDSFELTPMTIANQTGEYYVEVEAGDSLTQEISADFDLNDALVSIWARPSWANMDGVAHYFLSLYIDTNNRITVSKWIDGTIIISSVLGGVAKNAILTLPFSAGDEVFIGFRTSGGTLTAYADVDSDNTLETSSIGSLGTSVGGSATFYAGADVADNYFDGGLNIAILKGGSSADPITERFNSGDGERSEKEWYRKYSDRLVLAVPDPTSATLQANNALGSPAVVRNDTGRFVDWEGIVQDVGANILRNRHSEGGVRMTLLEEGYTNLMGTKDLNAWGKNRTPIVTAIPGPDGNATSAFTVEDNDGTYEEEIHEDMTFTGDAVKSIKIAVKENTHPGAGAQLIGLWDNVGAAWKLNMQVDSWDAGDPQITEVVGILLQKWQIGSTGWWVLECQTIAVTAANTHTYYIYPATQANQTGKIDVYFPSAFDAPFPPRSFLDASEVTTKDEFKKPISGWTPDQGYTLYGKIECFMLANTGDVFGIFGVGVYAGSSAMALITDQDSDSWRLLTSTADAGPIGSNIGGANVPTIGGTFEFRISVPPTGDITWGVSKNGGAEATQTHTPGDWDAAFDSLFFSLSPSAAGGLSGPTGHIEWKAESTAGLSLAQMQALREPDLFHYASGQTDELATPAFTTATKATPSRVIWSESKDGAGLPYGYMASATDEKIEVGVRSVEGTRYEASSGGAASVGWHTVGFTFDGSDLDAVLDCVVGGSPATLAGTYTGLDVSTLGAIRLGILGHVFDSDLGQIMIYNRVLTTAERKGIHNFLREQYPGLGAVA